MPVELHHMIALRLCLAVFSGPHVVDHDGVQESATGNGDAPALYFS